ncbi:MAG: phosphoribosylanthranilate isomerase [Hydrogenophilus sp.]|nr:phosphoribosylanthranilate isomerase [Hydrogenophilus sp.]
MILWSTPRIRVKICGITRVEDGLAAAAAGADAVGLVFYPASPRAVIPEQARRIANALPPFVTVVALFVNPSPEEVAAAVAALPHALLQFHGQESPEFCAAFGRPYLKAFAATSELQRVWSLFGEAAGWVVDTPTPAYGGSGIAFDWSLLPPPEARARPLIVAGGLTAENVGAAIAATRPWGVDVSSGVERAKGIKDAAKIAQFIAAVRAAEE